MNEMGDLSELKRMLKGVVELIYMSEISELNKVILLLQINLKIRKSF